MQPHRPTNADPQPHTLRTARRKLFDVGADDWICLFVVPVLCSLLVCTAESTEFYVGVNHPNASDSNSGLAPESPFRTIGRGTQELWPGDTLNIMAGVYREVVELPRSGTAANRIVIRAFPGDEGAVAIRGSDEVTGWTDEGNSTWSVSRSPLPLVTYPGDWPDYGALSKRREMVFIDGNPLTQVLSAGELAEGKFRVDATAGRYYVRYSGNLNDRLVEVATRDQGIYAYWIDFVVWNDLRIEHVANDLYTPAMFVRSYHEIRNCQVSNNNLEGIKPYDGAVILNSLVNRNGGVGINLSGSDCVLDSNETSYNSWRYGPDWHAGGIKMIYDRPTNNRIVRHTANYNNGRGIWLDHGGSGNVVEASVMEGNKIAGLFFEATEGPNWAINNVIVGTVRASLAYPEEDGTGIAIRESYDAYLYNNTISAVEGTGILIAGNERNGGLDYTANTRVYNNIVVDSGSVAVHFWVWGTAREEPRISSHHFDNNLYYGHATTVIFPIVSEPWGDYYWSLAEWQTNRSEDLESLSLPPGFVSPGTNNFSLSLDSPAIDSGDDLDEVTEDLVGCRRPKGAHADIGALEYCVEAGSPPELFTDGLESGDTTMWSSTAL